MNALKQYRRKSRGLPDYLNWSHIVAPGVVLCKDGSLLAGRYFKGSNLAHTGDTDWYAASDSVNRALCKLSGGWSLWVDAVRLPVSRFTDPVRNSFPDAVSSLIEDERRDTLTRDGACLESEYVMLLHFMPPLKHQGMLLNLIYDQDAAAQPSAASAILASFQRTLGEFDDQINAALTLRPMRDHRWTDEHGRDQLRSDLVNYLYFCVSGELIDIVLPPQGCYLDGIIGEKTVDPGDMPKVGDMFVACVGISGYPFPGGSTPGILTTLDLLPFPLRWSSRYIVLDQPEAAKQGQLIENKWKQKARGFKGILFPDIVANPDAAKMSHDASTMIERTQSMLEGTGYYTANIVMMDENPAVLDEQVRAVRRTIRDAGYPTRLETLNTMEAWLGTLPAHCIPNVRRSLIHTPNLADLLPLTSPWQGLDHNPCPLYPSNAPPLLQAVTVGSTPINISLHVGDVPHCLVFGPIGSGKSTLLATVSLQALRYSGAMVWAFDKGRSLMPAFRAAGRYYDIGSDNLSFCPLSVLETETDVAWAEDWIATCFHLQTGRPTQPQQTEAIHQAIQVMQNGTGRSLSHFVHQVQDQDVRDAMSVYTLKGSLGYMLDAETDGLNDDLMCGFEIAELMGMGERSLIPVLLYLFRRFTRALKGQPSYLLIDEAWTMLGHPVWRDKIREWLKELRKANCSVTMATQSLSDAARSGLMDVLLESCPTRFYGANPAAMIGTEEEPGPRQMYRTFGLTDAQIEMVRQAIPKRHYLYSSPDGAALIDLRLGKQTLAFVGAGSKDNLARIDRLFHDHGDGWTTHWLRERTSA
jgi:type IV secretion/conjugal transfer VirB4 family ATPase